MKKKDDELDLEIREIEGRLEKENKLNKMNIEKIKDLKLLQP